MDYETAYTNVFPYLDWIENAARSVSDTAPDGGSPQGGTPQDGTPQGGSPQGTPDEQSTSPWLYVLYVLVGVCAIGLIGWFSFKLYKRYRSRE